MFFRSGHNRETIPVSGRKGSLAFDSRIQVPYSETLPVDRSGWPPTAHHKSQNLRPQGQWGSPFWNRNLSLSLACLGAFGSFGSVLNVSSFCLSWTNKSFKPRSERIRFFLPWDYRNHLGRTVTKFNGRRCIVTIEGRINWTCEMSHLWVGKDCGIFRLQQPAKNHCWGK